MILHIEEMEKENYKIIKVGGTLELFYKNDFIGVFKTQIECIYFYLINSIFD